MHGQNLGSNFSMRAQMRAGNYWKAENWLRWTFFWSKCNCASLGAESPNGCVFLPTWTINQHNSARMKVKKLFSVSHLIAVINTACLEANLSFAGKNGPTNNNQATLFPLETSNDTKRTHPKKRCSSISPEPEQRHRGVAEHGNIRAKGTLAQISRSIANNEGKDVLSNLLISQIHKSLLN